MHRYARRMVPVQEPNFWSYLRYRKWKGKDDNRQEKTEGDCQTAATEVPELTTLLDKLGSDPGLGPSPAENLLIVHSFSAETSAHPGSDSPSLEERYPLHV